MMLMALPTPCRICPLLAVGHDSAGAQKQQLDEVAAVEGQVGHLLLGHHLPDGGRLRVNRSGVGLDLDLLRDVARGELEVDALHLVHVQRDVRADGQLETRLLRRHEVGADRQQRHNVGPIVVGRGLARESRLLVGDGHLDLGHHAPTRILHRTGDLAGGGLRPQHARRTQHDCQRSENQLDFSHVESPANCRYGSPGPPLHVGDCLTPRLQSCRRTRLAGGDKRATLRHTSREEWREVWAPAGFPARSFRVLASCFTRQNKKSAN